MAPTAGALVPVAPGVPEADTVASWNPATPCPLTCPGLSFTKVYRGIWLYATCFDPSGRVISLSVPGTPGGSVREPVAVNAGQFASRVPVTVLVPGESPLKVYRGSPLGVAR